MCAKLSLGQKRTLDSLTLEFWDIHYDGPENHLDSWRLVLSTTE